MLDPPFQTSCITPTITFQIVRTRVSASGILKTYNLKQVQFESLEWFVEYACPSSAGAAVSLFSCAHCSLFIRSGSISIDHSTQP